MFSTDTPNVVPLVTPMNHGRARGSLIQTHIDWARDFGSRTEVIELFEAMGDALRHQVLAAQPARWYPFATVVDLQMTIADRWGNGEVRCIERIGAYAAQKELAPLREYLDPSRIHDFFGTAAVLHRDSLDFGASDYQAFSGGGGRMIVSSLGRAPSHRAFLAGFYREAIAQHRAADPTIRETAGVFEMCWR